MIHELSNKRKTQIGILALLIFAGILCVSWVFTHKEPFVFTEHLEETAITIDNQKITVKELSFYIMDVEEYVNVQALKYNQEDPGDYWNTHFSAGNDSAFVSDAAKDQVYDICISDYLYAMAAKENDYELSDLAKKTAETEGMERYRSMSQKQLQVTRLSEEELIDLAVRESLATSYAKYLSETVDWSYTVLSPSTELSPSGEYYKEKIMNNHQINVNKKLKTKITLGNLTIN